MTGTKQRLDELTVARHPELSRNVAQSWIAQGKVLVDGQPVTKAGTKLKPSVKIEVIAEQPKFVCRAGLKLEKALSHFGVDVAETCRFWSEHGWVHGLFASERSGEGVRCRRWVRASG